MTEPAKKRGRGRPSEYSLEHVRLAAIASRGGATVPEIASMLGKPARTVDRWIATHEDFRRAVKLGALSTDRRVERSLYERAVGYEVEVEKAFFYRGEIVKTTVKERVEPDVAAQIFWLKNRRRDKWNNSNEAQPAMALLEQLLRLATAKVIDGHSSQSSGSGEPAGQLDQVAASLRLPSPSSDT